MHCLIIRFAHAEHANVCKDNISILNLVLGTVLSHIHVVKLFGEILLPSSAPTTARPLAGMIRSFVYLTIMLLFSSVI